MAHPIDVGSVLGGRYKVTDQVLVSHDQDLVLDGLDQVLNRPVSILVAGPSNASQVSQSAREVATGERPGNMQILDLGVSDGTTYLITNHASAADLLDLIVADNPPYVEPFFTDTLGSEIFGRPRSSEPETYDDEEDHEEEAPAERPSFLERFGVGRGESSSARKQRGPSDDSPTHGSGAVAGGAAAGAAAAVSAQSAAAPNQVPARPDTPPKASRGATAPTDVAGPGVPTAAAPRVEPAQDQPRSAPEPVQEPEKPKVTLWSDEDYDFINEDHARSTGAAAAAADAPRKASNFPASIRDARPVFDDVDDDYDTRDEEPKSRRWLVGGIIGVILIGALVFAFTNLGSLFSGNTSASQSSAPANQQPAPSGNASSGAAEPTAQAVPPEVTGVSRIPTTGTDIYAQFDGDLQSMIDNNPASYWSKLEFATDNFGGFAQNLAVAIQLKQPADIKSIAISQLGGSGGSFAILVNDKPSLDGAKEVARNSFTAPQITLPVSSAAKGQYVIINVTQLPRLQNPLTKYPYGLRIAEVKVQ